MVTVEPAAPLRALIVMPLATPLGGSEVMLQQLVEYRGDAGVEPTVAFLESGPMIDWCRDRGARAVALGAGRLRQARRTGRTVRALVRLARETRAEVVIGWMAKGQVYGGLTAAATGLPSVWLQSGTPSGLAALDRVAALTPAKLVITLSDDSDLAMRRMIPPHPTTVIHPGVDVARFDAERIGDQRAVRSRLGLPPDGVIFGSVGRLNSWKGFHVLLDAARPVFERHPEATLVIVGGRHELESAYADDLHDQAVRLGQNGRVLLVGHQPNPEEWMHAMDLFVHTSRGEPFGIVVIEAMALGKPVIAAAEGGPTEVITPGVDGLLSPYGDWQALGASITRLLSDDQLRQRFGRAARQRAGDFSVQRYARRFGAAVAQASS
jgi:glycosyltransferase involved in cell wall biosynthesis